ncbi:MAG: DEAD/DEAH box helicase [Armatimonadetes bacterium]|nr:DEAD/DEAH box helicase [Armatimonadota bacterium]
MIARRPYRYWEDIELWVRDRIAREDAERQKVTAREILDRLGELPGLVLGDDVGMGKTFVALAVAASVAHFDPEKRPVVVMVPASLHEKWPRDFALFREKCLPPSAAEHLRAGTARKAVEFLKLLDDPPERRKQIIFVTHGALSRSLGDPWVMLALIQRAIRGKHGVNKLRQSLRLVLGQLLYLRHVDKGGTDVWVELLQTPPERWLRVLCKYGIDPEGDRDASNDDDPVPRSVCDVLPHLDTTALYEALEQIPRRHTKHFERRLRHARAVLKDQCRDLWKDCLAQLDLSLPLLVLDEAHHVKNPGTRLASLFHVPEAVDDANEVAAGPLGGVFERMLFLTATPFQLGHDELVSVLERFDGIDWQSKRPPECSRDDYHRRLSGLRASLDAAQHAAIALDTAWGRLRPDDLIVDEQPVNDVEQWWRRARKSDRVTTPAAEVKGCWERANIRMRDAEEKLRPWVIRHVRPDHLPDQPRVPRRLRREGAAILDRSDIQTGGIPVEDCCVLPFLIATRAACQTGDARALFAEGLCSCYEAFLHTRAEAKAGRCAALDTDDDTEWRIDDLGNAADWYLNTLESILTAADAPDCAQHPKLAATVARTVKLWESGEKVLVFCHYIATGRALRQYISSAIHARICALAASKLKCAPEEAPDLLERIAQRFFDEESPVRRAWDGVAEDILSEFEALTPWHDALVQAVRRNVRTPSFLARYFPLEPGHLDAAQVSAATGTDGEFGRSLQGMIRDFFEFLVNRCGAAEREHYIDAVKRIQTGSHTGSDVMASFSKDELEGHRADQLLPNVRLVNGASRPETRQRLMLAFNTPFYPEVLIASSVMAEGVDLHLNCQHVIHHDLSWNPSCLEQRTGRVDRIGAKAERTRRSIEVFLPYIAETQDEKMFRVVMDRERWFKVVMGERFELDALTTERIAQRLPLPESAASELALDLAVWSSADRGG